MKMLSAYRIPSNSHKTKKGFRSWKWPQLTSKDLKRPQLTSNDPEIKPYKSKNKSKGEACIEITDKNLDETFHNNNL